MTAADAMGVGGDRLEMAHGGGVLAGREGRDPVHEWQRHRTRDRMALPVEVPQTVDERRKRGLVAAAGVHQRGVDLAEDEARPRHTRGEIGERPPRSVVPAPFAVETESPQQRRAVDHRQPRVDGADDVALEDVEGGRMHVRGASSNTPGARRDALKRRRRS